MTPDPTVIHPIAGYDKGIYVKPIRGRFDDELIDLMPHNDES